MKQRRLIPIEIASRYLDYDPETGVFRWKEKISDKTVVGSIAGSGKGRRDVRISMHGVLYQAHRLAWAIMLGEQPPDLIDHVNGDTIDNRWENLRDATTSQNGANRSAQCNNAAKVKGVYFYPQRKTPWLARLSCNGVIRLNRYYRTKEEAAAAYLKAARHYFGPYAKG